WDRAVDYGGDDEEGGREGVYFPWTGQFGGCGAGGWWGGGVEEVGGEGEEVGYEEAGGFGCGIPIYSPEPTAPCLTCGTVQNLSINPAIIGALLDETGALEAEKLQWTPKAWRELLGEVGAMGILSADKGAGEFPDGMDRRGGEAMRFGGENVMKGGLEMCFVQAYG
ncbi:hypothetical protein V500_08155, partial [Pseudogymnoascus sp. VKM F-4518 (FW-2643)]